MSKVCAFWKNDDPSQTVATARIAPKSARAGPLHIAHTVLDFIQIGSLSAELLRTREDRFCPLEYLQYSLFDPIMNFNQMQRLIDKRPQRMVVHVFTPLV